MTTRSSYRIGCAIGAAAAALLLSVSAQAQNLIYGNSAGTNTIHVIDKTTGVQVRSCSPNKGNGRGIVVVGNIAYITVANSNNVFRIDINTCADLGIAFAVAGATGLSTMAFDGTNFWIGDYSGTNNAFYISPTGTLIRTVALPLCTSFCDGLEFFNGKLISNRGDPTGPYDVYDLNGNVLQAAFIPAAGGHAGIAFDGTNFYVSSIFTSQIEVYNGTTGALINTLNLTGGSFLIEDLSADYAIVLGPVGSTNIPTMSEWAMIVMAALLALSGFYFLRRRSR